MGIVPRNAQMRCMKFCASFPVAPQGQGKGTFLILPCFCIAKIPLRRFPTPKGALFVDSTPQRGICADCPESTWVVQLSGRRFPGEEKRQTKKSAQPPAVRTNSIVHRLPVTAGAQVWF